MRHLRKRPSASSRASHISGPLIGFLCFVVLCLTTGCGTFPKSNIPPEIKFDIQSTSSTNEGKTFYVLVRTVTDAGFLTETYNSIAGTVFAEPPLPDILAKHVVFPGRKLEFNLKNPGKSMAVYCLFTKPGSPWKTMLREPFGYEYVLKLGENNVANIDRKEHGVVYRWCCCLWPFY